MNTNVSKIVDEWSYRLSLIEEHDGSPDLKSYGDLTVLRSVLTDYEWPIEACFELFKKMGNKVIIGEMSLDQKNVEKLYKEKKLSKEILKSANSWIKKYIKQLEKKDLGKVSLVKTTAANVPQIKGGSPNRIEFTLEFPDVGRDSRPQIFDAAKSLGGLYKTKKTDSRIQSSVGSVVYNGKGGHADREDLEIWIAFKGGKSSKTAGSVSTDAKEGFVGLFFQSKWKSVVTKTNIGDCVSTLKKELSSIKGEGSSTKKELEAFLLTVPTSDPKKGFLDELNDPLSIALKLKSSYGSWTWERDTVFNKIRKTASTICKVPADKWNPADAYLIKGTAKSDIGDGDNITTKIAPINNQFVTEWGKSDGSVVGVSLKQASAQAGKGKTYLKSFVEMTKKFDYNLTKNEREKLNMPEESWVGAYIEQIQDWRSDIKSTLGGLSISYDYSHAGSLFDAAAEDFSKKLVEFTYQKYASIKMFKFMVDALKVNENMFVDSAAFASGLTGYSPTFFKAKGNKSGSGAKVETFQGNGGLELVGNKIKIEDTNTNAGVLFTFEVKNNVMGQAKVKMNIRFNGSTQATLELLDVKW
jgi:hypothetical protein